MSSFRNDYPDFAAIESLVVRARVERAIAVSQMIGSAVAFVVNGVKSLAARLGDGLQAERERRAVEADAFLKRSVPRY